MNSEQLELPDPLHVTLSAFSGPLDLLLELIRKKKMDIFTISLAEICTPYLEAIQARNDRNFDTEGEFMVIAATLIQIKARRLLPIDEEPIDPDGDVIDPEEELRQKLIDYIRFKEVAKMLNSRDVLEREVFQRPDIEPDPQQIKIVYKDASVYELVKSFQQIREKQRAKQPYHVSEEGQTLEKCVKHMLVILSSSGEGKQFRFADMLGENVGHEFVILCFCAALELARLKLIHIIQPDENGEIYLKPKPIIKEAAENIFNIKIDTSWATA